MKLGLRNRIAFYYLAATALLVALAFVTVYVVVHKTVYGHLDGDLQAESLEVLSSVVVLQERFVFANEGEWAEREHVQVEVNPTFIEVVDLNGSLIKKSANLFDKRLDFDSSRTVGEYFNSKLADAPVRQLQLPITNPAGRPLGFLILAIPRKDAELVLNNLFVVLLAVFPVLLGVLFWVTRTIAGKSIEPVETIISTAEQITRENLKQRIPLPEREDELHRLATTINELLNRLEDALLRERQFTADSSHELRTPIAAVKGTLEVLIRKPRNVEHYRTKIRESIRELNRMTDLIERLLLLARYDGGKLQPQIGRVDLVKLLEEVKSRMLAMAAERGISLSACNFETVYVAADPSMLAIILENVFSNSIKYAKANTAVNIELEEKPNEIICSITDQGQGIAPDKLGNIFDRFYRTDDSRSSKIAGFGLGLSIVRKLAELQGFDVSMTSEQNKGTVFRLILPRAE